MPNTIGLGVVLAGSTPALGQFILLGPSCNSNGIDDPCDIDCNAADCNTNDCGGSTDYDSTEKPDECAPHTFYYVDVDAIGNSNGLSWANAYDDLKFALDDINANMPCGIV